VIIVNNPMIAQRAATFYSIPGVGPVNVIKLIAGFDELGACLRTQIALSTGDTPMNWYSGQMKGRRIFKGGKANDCAVIYMVAVAAIQSNSGYKAF
jgi:hypothetical protein